MLYILQTGPSKHHKAEVSYPPTSLLDGSGCIHNALIMCLKN